MSSSPHNFFGKRIRTTGDFQQTNVIAKIKCTAFYSVVTCVR